MSRNILLIELWLFVLTIGCWIDGSNKCQAFLQTTTSRFAQQHQPQQQQQPQALLLPHRRSSFRNHHFLHRVIYKDEDKIRRGRSFYRLMSSSSLVNSPEHDKANDVQPQQQQRPQNRPDWAKSWMPTWFVTMRPMVQLAVVVTCYLFHLMVLTQHSIAFSYQLIPNDHGHYQSIGLDSVAGILCLAGYMWLQRSMKGLPLLWSSPTNEQAPWQLHPTSTPHLHLSSNSTASSLSSFLSWRRPGPKSTSIICLILLVQTYFLTGRFSIFWEDVFYAAAGAGFSMTIAMHRSLCVLMGHLTWVGLGGLLLRWIPRPQPFFNNNNNRGSSGAKQSSANVIVNDTHDNVNQDGNNSEMSQTQQQQQRQQRPMRWFTNQWNDYWVWWVVGGYYVSAWLFNVADFCNQSVLPTAIFEEASESVVSQLINPENNDLLASMVGFIAPCISAPWWEEVLYRGFLLPAMCLQMKFPLAVLFSGIMFSAHHMSATGSIPLAFLGWAWALLYAKSGNLMVTIMVHALWNSRVFLGNWLGL